MNNTLTLNKAFYHRIDIGDMSLKNERLPNTGTDFGETELLRHQSRDDWK